MPSGWLDGLTFSTYETAHSSLRQYKLAQVVATFTNAQKGLDPDYFTVRGFALDTFAREKFSVELKPEAQPALHTVADDLIRLVADGDWERIAKRQEHCGRQSIPNQTRENFFLDLLKLGGEQVQQASFRPLRLKLLKEWQTYRHKSADLPDPLPSLLAPQDTEEWTEFQDASLPPQWLGVAVYSALHNPATQTAAIEPMQSAEKAVLQSFSQTLAGSSEEQQLATLDMLFPPLDDPGITRDCW